MSESFFDRRLAENEVIFRQANEEAQMFIKDKNKQLSTEVKRLHFLCECSNFACRAHIDLPFDEYNQLHANSSQFIVQPGHEDPNIERVMRRETNYFVVEKYITPPPVVKKTRPKKK